MCAELRWDTTSSGASDSNTLARYDALEVLLSMLQVGYQDVRCALMACRCR